MAIITTIGVMVCFYKVRTCFARAPFYMNHTPVNSLYYSAYFTHASFYMHYTLFNSLDYSGYFAGYSFCFFKVCTCFTKNGASF